MKVIVLICLPSVLIVVILCSSVYFCLYELMIIVPDNSYGHIGTLIPFKGVSQKDDMIPSKPQWLVYMEVDLRPIFLGRSS